MSFQFHYTPPPEEVIRNGQLATYALYAAMLGVPKVWLGALIGGLGSAIITFQVASQARGEAALLSMLTEPPMWAVLGSLIGALVSFVGQVSVRFVLKRLRTKKYPFDDQQDFPHHQINTAILVSHVIQLHTTAG